MENKCLRQWCKKEVTCLKEKALIFLKDHSKVLNNDHCFLERLLVTSRKMFGKFSDNLREMERSQQP